MRNCSRSAARHPERDAVCYRRDARIDASIIALAQPQFWPPNIQLNDVFIMARPIIETPVLKGEDAFRGFDCGDKERSTHLL